MNRVYLSVIGVLVAMSLALAYWLDEGRAALAHQETVTKALTEALVRAQEREKYDRKVLVARQAKSASQARKSAQAQQALTEVLQRNLSWSDTHVPDDIQNRLLGRSDGLPEPSSGVPNAPEVHQGATTAESP